VDGVIRRGEAPSAGNSRPASPPLAPPGQADQPPSLGSSPVVVTARWKSTFSLRAVCRNALRLLAMAACLSDMDPELSSTNRASTCCRAAWS
jgi:hypothetical protein